MQRHALILAALLVWVALVPAAVAETDEDENCEKIEKFGPAGRPFHVEGATSFHLLTRQSYGPEHAVGAREFPVMAKTGGTDKTKRTFNCPR